MATLVDGFFLERNWQFGLPEPWFRKAMDSMWTHMSMRCTDHDRYTSPTCPRCTRELNPHWVCLVFSVFALSPPRLVMSDALMYFWKGMEARRLIEEFMLSSPDYSSAPTENIVHGVSLSCIAVALLGTFLADRGRVSDAWKITGTAIRNAQAVGLHRDPGWRKWEAMDREESELRLSAWWLLLTNDR